MATKFWRCETCGYIGPKKEFKTPAGSRCPNQDGPNAREHDHDSDRENVFPYRVFVCNSCGIEGDGDHFFREYPADPDPIQERFEARCGNGEKGCGEFVKVKQIK